MELQSIAEKHSEYWIPVKDATFCAVDVETSGLSSNSRIVEIGAVRFDLRGNHKEYQTLVNPCVEIAPEASAIHGITDDMVSLAPLAGDVLPGLLNFMDSSVFIAHNASFDVGMLAREMFRYSIEPPRIPVICTIGLARKILSGLPNYRLSTLVDYLNLDIPTLHNALPDAHAARLVLIEALKNAPQYNFLHELPGFRGSFRDMAIRHFVEIPHTNDAEELLKYAQLRIPIEIEYENHDELGPSIVTPHFLFEKKGKAYLAAYCHREGIRKSYRLDRIRAFRQAWS